MKKVPRALTRKPSRFVVCSSRSPGERSLVHFFSEGVMMLHQTNRRFRFFAFIVFAAFGILAMSTPLSSAQATFLSFDEPQAGNAFGGGTYPVAINSNGVIVGFYFDAQKLQHGFLRAADGTFTSFDAPGALATDPTAISSNGIVVGVYSHPTSTSNLPYGFLRYANGQFVTLLAPGTAYTVPIAINDVGQITGWTANDSGEFGFLWTEKSRFTLFSVPFSGPSTAGSAINASGQIGGDYLDPHIAGRYHAYIRTSAGEFITLDPGVVVLVTGVTALNDSGQSAGYFEDTSHRINAFVADSAGTVTVLPSMGRIGDYAVGINDAGVVAGFSLNHFAPTEVSFLRDAAGNITTISLPFPNAANQPVGINAGGQVVGLYVEAGVRHGWLMQP